MCETNPISRLWIADWAQTSGGADGRRHRPAVITVSWLYHERLSRSGMWLILLLRVNPLTSSDLVSYAAGLTGIGVWKVMLGTLLGMAPLCWMQAYLADGILRAIPQLLYPLLVLCGIYAVVVVWVILFGVPRLRG